MKFYVIGNNFNKSKVINMRNNNNIVTELEGNIMPTKNQKNKSDKKESGIVQCEDSFMNVGGNAVFIKVSQLDLHKLTIQEYDGSEHHVYVLNKKYVQDLLDGKVKNDEGKQTGLRLGYFKQ